jgi:twitching motility protein PilT
MDRQQLDQALGRLVAVGGSDLHVKAGSGARVRLNGRLLAVAGESRPSAPELLELAQAIMQQRTWEQFQARSEADFAYSVEGVGRFRVNAFRQRGWVGLVFRHVRPCSQSIGELGLPDAVRRLADELRGIVLVTGPTGSGKTTTLAAMIDYINASRDCHIVTIEDPIEILHVDKRALVDQREVGFDTENFPVALRAALRQDPDVILVGEMRDLETVTTALTAAETGHLVLSTLHTGDSVETINRIVNLFPAEQQPQARTSLATALRGTICQRLVPQTGGGRVPALEIMIANGRVQQCILDPDHTGDIADIVAGGEYYGMQTFAQSLTGLLQRGLIDVDTALANAPNPHDLSIALEHQGLLDPTLS